MSVKKSYLIFVVNMKFSCLTYFLPTKVIESGTVFAQIRQKIGLFSQIVPKFDRKVSYIPIRAVLWRFSCYIKSGRKKVKKRVRESYFPPRTLLSFTLFLTGRKCVKVRKQVVMQSMNQNEEQSHLNRGFRFRLQVWSTQSRSLLKNRN